MPRPAYPAIPRCHAIGTEPRQATQEQVEMLADLAAVIMDDLECDCRP